jgi:hypothetical protein
MPAMPRTMATTEQATAVNTRQAQALTRLLFLEVSVLLPHQIAITHHIRNQNADGLAVS